jgi:hypothetical protein
MKPQYKIKQVWVGLGELQIDAVVAEYEIYLNGEYLGAVDTEERAKRLIEAHKVNSSVNRK